MIDKRIWTPHWNVQVDPREQYFKGMLDALDLVESATRNCDMATHLFRLRRDIELGRDGEGQE